MFFIIQCPFNRYLSVNYRQFPSFALHMRTKWSFRVLSSSTPSISSPLITTHHHYNHPPPPTHGQSHMRIGKGPGLGLTLLVYLFAISCVNFFFISVLPSNAIPKKKKNCFGPLTNNFLAIPLHPPTTTILRPFCKSYILHFLRKKKAIL